MTDYFPPPAAQSYDERNAKLAPIAEAMHFLSRLVLEDLPSDARILCVGVGTGAEILSLAKTYPNWTFVGVDPSTAMLEVCRERLREAGYLERCELIHGYAKDAPQAGYDAVLSVLVGHFVPRSERSDFYGQMTSRLKPGGYLIDIEISYDLDSEELPSMLENWKRVQALMGATPESLDNLPATLREKLTILPPQEIEGIMKSAGITMPVRFFQAFMISGWYGRIDG